MGINVAFQDVAPVLAQHRSTFRARCEEWAFLVAAGELTLQEAVDDLQEAVELPGGLLERLDQNAIQKTMAVAFAASRSLFSAGPFWTAEDWEKWTNLPGFKAADACWIGAPIEDVSRSPPPLASLVRAHADSLSIGTRKTRTRRRALARDDW
jgi:hypothetical protein